MKNNVLRAISSARRTHSAVMSFSIKHREKAHKIGSLIIPVILMLVVLFSLISLANYSDFKRNQSSEVFKEYSSASDGNAESIQRLEELTHEGSGHAYLLLQLIYREEAVRKSGLDLNDKNADFTRLDFSKSDAILLRALKEAPDLELMTYLGFNSMRFDNSNNNMPELLISENATIREINEIKVNRITSLTDDQKKELVECSRKLREKFDNMFSLVFNYHSVGTCSKYPKRPAYKVIFGIDG